MDKSWTNEHLNNLILKWILMNVYNIVTMLYVI